MYGPYIRRGVQMILSSVVIERTLARAGDDGIHRRIRVHESSMERRLPGFGLTHKRRYRDHCYCNHMPLPQILT